MWRAGDLLSVESSVFLWRVEMAHNIDNYKEVGKSLERARRSLLPPADMERLVRSATRFHDVISQNQRSLAAIASQIESSSAVLRLGTRYADLAKAFESQLTLPKLAAITPNLLGAFQANAARWRGITESLGLQTARWRSMMESLDLSAVRMKLPESAFEQMKRSALVWDSGLSEAVKRFAETNLLSQRADLCSRLLEPSGVFSKFAEETLLRIKGMPEPRMLRALNASLALADAQHLANIDALSSFATATVDDERVSMPRLLAGPFVQQEELLDLPEVDDEEEVDMLASRSPAAQASERSREVLTLTTCCNKASCVKGGSEIFKPTTKVMEVFTDLPWLTPQDEKTFAEFIDCVYFVLYEGAGKDNLRFLSDHGGPLARGDCQVVWCIKILRNKWLRHDVDHGKQSDIERSWGDLGSNLRWLGLEGYPRSRADFRRLHERLLEEVGDFLSKLLHRI